MLIGPHTRTSQSREARKRAAELRAAGQLELFGRADKRPQPVAAKDDGVPFDDPVDDLWRD
jgi:hypothetical protein